MFRRLKRKAPAERVLYCAVSLLFLVVGFIRNNLSETCIGDLFLVNYRFILKSLL
jgi:hypothetical protein